MHEEVPSKPPRRRPVTKPVTIRMDMELWRRLEEHAPRERRSVGNLLQKLVADGLDALDEGHCVRAVQRNYRDLLADLAPREMRMLLARQEAILARRRGERRRIPPLPPSMRVRRRTTRRK